MFNLKTKIISLFLLSFFVLSILLSSVNGADSSNNYLSGCTIYQNGYTLDIWNNGTYVENDNITVSNTLLKDFHFKIGTFVNSSEVSTWIYFYQGVSMQIYDEENDAVFQGAVYPPTPTIIGYDPLPLTTVVWHHYETLNLYNTYFYFNITLWTYNGTDWNDIESFKFFLIDKDYEYEPQTQTDETSFIDVWLSGFVLCIFCFPLSLVGAIKLQNPKLIGVSVFFLLGIISTLYVLIGVNPFYGG